MLPLNDCRLLIDRPLSGRRNMAIDETLLNSGIAGTASLRFYQWSEPTISLGHFQAVQGQLTPTRFAGLESVRRLSGGGAILHHHELTYSCVLPKWHPVTRDPGTLYDLVHEVIRDLLTSYGVDVRLRGEEAFEDQSFLCYSRGDARDLVCGSHKLVGSAQRRRQGAVLQHGSVLLRQSEFAPEFPGVFELSGKSLSADQLVPGISQGILNRLELRVSQECLTAAEELRIAERLQP